MRYLNYGNDNAKWEIFHFLLYYTRKQYITSTSYLEHSLRYVVNATMKITIRRNIATRLKFV